MKAHRLKALLAIGAAATLLIAAVVASLMYFKTPSGPPAEEIVTMDQILQALDRRAFAETETLAKRAARARRFAGRGPRRPRICPRSGGGI